MNDKTAKVFCDRLGLELNEISTKELQVLFREIRKDERSKVAKEIFDELEFNALGMRRKVVQYLDVPVYEIPQSRFSKLKKKYLKEE